MELERLFEEVLKEGGKVKNSYITKNGKGPRKGKNVYYGFGNPEEDEMGIWMCSSLSSAASSVYESNHPMRVFEYLVAPGVESKVVNLYDDDLGLDIDDPNFYKKAKEMGIVAYVNGEDMLYATFGLLDPSLAKKTGNSVMIDWTNEDEYDELIDLIEDEEENIWR